MINFVHMQNDFLLLSFFFYLHYTVWWREKNTVRNYTRHCAHSCRELCGAMVLPLICKASWLVLDWKLVWTLQTKWSALRIFCSLLISRKLQRLQLLHSLLLVYLFRNIKFSACQSIFTMKRRLMIDAWIFPWKKVSIQFIIINSCLVSLRSNYSLNILH